MLLSRRLSTLGKFRFLSNVHRNNDETLRVFPKSMRILGAVFVFQHRLSPGRLCDKGGLQVRKFKKYESFMLLKFVRNSWQDPPLQVDRLPRERELGQNPLQI